MEDVHREFYFCAVNMDGLEDDEKNREEKSKEKLEAKLAKRRKTTAERVRRFRAKQKLEEEKLKAIASTDDSPIYYLLIEEQEQVKQSNEPLSNAEHERSFNRENKKLEIENLKPMAALDNASSQSSTDDSQMYYLQEKQEQAKQNKKPLTSAERMRRFRMRKKLEKEKLRGMAVSTNASSQSSTDRLRVDYLPEEQEQIKQNKKPLTGAERVKRYREKKRLEMEKLKAMSAVSTNASMQSITDQSQMYYFIIILLYNFIHILRTI